jgi:transcriptional antiterminator RfaH
MNASTEHAAKAWYLVQCKPKQDERAEEHLQRQGYVCFRSKYSRERILRGQRRVISESLFPGYLFIQLSLQDSWGPLRSTRGVSRVVGFGGQPLPIRNALIDELQEHNSQAIVSTLLKQGETVRITEGPFTDLEAVFLAMDGEERVLLLMNFLQREQRISLPLAGVSKL